MSAPTATPQSGYAAEEPTHTPPWHGLVVWDVFCNALTTGLFITAAVGELVRPAAFAPLGAWAYPLALVLLLIDLTLLVLDLGDPLRFHHMLRVVKPSSPMSLGTWCLTLYSLPLAALVGLDLLLLGGVLSADSAALGVARRALVATGLPFAFGSMAYKGVLFSTSSQPGWKDSRWLGAYHVASAFALGSAALLALALGSGAEAAAALLRPASAALLLLQLVPLALLAAELRRPLAGRYTRAQLALAAVLALASGVLPLSLLAGGPFAQAVGAIVALAGGWVVRQFAVHLPHRLSLHDGHSVSVG